MNTPSELLNVPLQYGMGAALIIVVGMFLWFLVQDRKERSKERTEFLNCINNFNNTINEMVLKCKTR